MKHRSRTDIAYQILQTASGGASKTKIMYRAYVSFARLKDYLTVLTQNELLQYDTTTHLYKTTVKGNRFVEFYEKIGQIAPTVTS